MDPLLPRRRLPLLLLAVLVAASHGVPSSGDGDGGRYDPSMCLRQNYTCGGFSISYPFYITTGDLLGDTSSYCGYPGLEIQCEEDQAFLELESGKYTVTHIDYDNLTVQLVDPEVLDWRNGCPRTDHNVTLRSFEWLFYPNTTVDLLFFFNCNFLSDLPSQPSESNATTCRFDVGQPSIGLSFVFLEQDVPFRNTNWWQKCGLVIEVPLLKSVLPPDPLNDSAWKNGGYGRSLSEGFQLAVNQSGKTQACEQCEKSEGQCGHNQTGGFMACLCSGGHVSSANNRTADPSGKPLDALVLVLQIAAGITGSALLHSSYWPLPFLFDITSLLQISQEIVHCLGYSADF